MTYIHAVWITSALFFISIGGIEAATNNLTCYQCTKNANEECGEETLLPCPPVSDRCVTHITKDAKNGFSIKRECGLGPCGFNDDMMNRGLGLDGCDRSKDEYFCVFCCRDSGCNKSKAPLPVPSVTSLLAALSILLVNIQLVMSIV
ncbi:hypothetical protein CBL_00456 [Carabus blaptoides fortunei]